MYLNLILKTPQPFIEFKNFLYPWNTIYTPIPPPPQSSLRNMTCFFTLEFMDITISVVKMAVYENNCCSKIATMQNFM